MAPLPRDEEQQPLLAPSWGPRSGRMVIDVSTRSVMRIVIGLLALAFVADVAGQMRDVLVWIFAAAFLAIALNPLVVRLESRMGRRPAATVVFVGFVVLFVAILVTLVAPFVTQVDQLTTAVPTAISEAKHNPTLRQLDRKYHLAAHAKQHLDVLPNVIFGTVDTVLGGAVAVSTVFFLTLFLLYELPALGRVALSQIPPERRPRIVAAVNHMNRNIGGYVAGNLVISLICGAVTTISLYLLDVPFSLALGVFMAVFDLIPLVGATIGSFGVVAAAWVLVDTRAAIIMFIIVTVYQQIENHILQPLIYGRTVQIPSLTVLVAVLCGGAVLGLVGALLAIPIAGTIQAVVSELLQERAERLGTAAPPEASR
ncbi:MAG TPA: AI-2E family transporter [Gaiellales bacterium]|nr:AI-2E family transporter [Gaiellales bacterium]